MENVITSALPLMEKYYKVCVKNRWNMRSITKYIKAHNLKEFEFRYNVFKYLVIGAQQDFFRLKECEQRVLVGSKNYRFINQYKGVIEEISEYMDKDLLGVNFSLITKNSLLELIYTNDAKFHDLINIYLLARIKEKKDLLLVDKYLKSLKLDTHDICLRLARYELSMKVSKDVVKEDFKYLLKEEVKTPQETLEEIIKAKDFKEVVYIFDNSIVNVTTLINLVLEAEKNNTLEKTLLESVLEKLKFYNEYQIKKLEYDRKYGVIDMVEYDTKEAKRFVNEYLESKLSLEKFLENSNITMKVWEYYVNLIKLEDTELYRKYEASCGLIKVADTILYYLENGIEEDGVMRKFNVLDYFMLTSLSFEELYEQEIKGKYNKHEIYIFRSFFSRPLTERTIRYFYEDKLIVNVEFGEDNMPIIGSGHVVTNEEKEEIINFLREHNCLYERTLSLAVTRYFKKLKENETSKVKKLSKEN